MTLRGEQRYSSAVSWPRHEMEVSGQVHATANLFWRKRQPHPLDRAAGGPQSRSGRYGVEKNSLSLSWIEPRASSPYLAAIPSNMKAVLYALMMSWKRFGLFMHLKSQDESTACAIRNEKFLQSDVSWHILRFLWPESSNMEYLSHCTKSALVKYTDWYSETFVQRILNWHDHSIVACNTLPTLLQV
jgi:hypothetical protein